LSKRRKILIIGGARFHGFQIAESLAKRRDEVFVLNRKIYRYEYPPGIKHLLADRTSTESLNAVLSGYFFDVIIDNNAYNASHIKTIMEVIKDRCGHYVFISTAAVYLSHASKRKLKEDEADRIIRGAFSPRVLKYAENKFAAEEFIRNYYGKVNYTIMRPPNIFGEGDFLGKLSYFYYRLNDGGRILLEEEIKEFSLIYVKDMVNSVISVIGNPKCFRKTLNFADPVTYDYESFFSSVYGSDFSRSKIIKIPAEKMWIEGYFIPFVWGPMLNTATVHALLPELEYTPIEKWGSQSLKWELENLKREFSSEEFKKVRKHELALIQKLCQ